MNLRVNANAIITNKEDKILLVNLKKGPFAGGLCIPGGGVYPGELIEQAIKREVLEETGVEIKNALKRIGFCELMHTGVKDHRIVMLLHSTSDDEAKDTPEGSAIWLSYEEALVNKKLIPFTRESLKMWKERRDHFMLLEEDTGVTKNWNL